MHIPQDVVGEDEVPEGMTSEELAGVIRAEIDDAVDFVEQDIGQDRAESTKYYRGDLFGNEEDGRSQVVTRDVRDSVRQVLPSLMDVFFGAERAVEFVPHGPEDVAGAEQQTDYINYILLQDNPGFEIFHSVFKDSLYQKTGIVKYWNDESVTVTYQDFSGLSDAQLGQILGQDDVELVSQTSEFDRELAPQFLAIGEQPPELHSGQLRRTRVKPRIRIMAVPPEEFLIDRNAKDIDSASYVGHRMLMSFNDLVALGYDPEFLEDHIHNSSQLSTSVELQERHEGGTHPFETHLDSERKILYTESYVRVDADNDGVAELRKICTIGESQEIVNGEFGEPVEERPFASFCPDPEPHLFFGNDIADQAKDIQLIRSNVLRATLDSLALSIHPRQGYVEGQVDVDDVLNTEIGATIRMQQIGAYQPFVIPFVGKESLPILKLLTDEKEARLGQHNMALEADALQSTTKAAVNAQVEAATQNLKLIARIYAETGMRRLFRGLLKLVVAHQDQPRMIRLRNEWVEIDPATWHADKDVSVNVGLGHGMTEDRIRSLGMILTTQKELLSQMGPSNPVVGLGQLRNTLGRLAELGGYKDTAQFYKPIPVDFEMPPPPPPPPDPAQLLAEVEMKKIQADMQIDAAKLDLDRDKLLTEVQLKAAELQAKFPDAKIDFAAIRASIDFDVLVEPDNGVLSRL